MNLTDAPLGGRGGVRALGIAKASAGLLALFNDTSGTNSYTATRGCLALILANGPGASGGADNSAQASGGGGGAVGYKVARLAAGQTLSWSVGSPGTGVSANTDGNDATATTVTLPNGVVLSAGGGKKGTRGGTSQTGGLGGQPSSGWDIARAGGNGGDGVSGAGTAGQSPVGGGTGGAGSGNGGGGGGPAGLSDLISGLSYGSGTAAAASSSAGGAPGAGSGGGTATASGNGGAGRVVVVILDA